MPASVLVVEDYADLRSAIATALARRNCSCEEASNAGDAIGRLKEHSFSYILLSPSYPLSDDPVMAFLAQNQPDELHKVVLMADETADEYPTLVKPFGEVQLMAKLKLA